MLGSHKSSITALAWSPNGTKLFSGDERGKIIQSNLDFDKVKVDGQNDPSRTRPIVSTTDSSCTFVFRVHVTPASYWRNCLL